MKVPYFSDLISLLAACDPSHERDAGLIRDFFSARPPSVSVVASFLKEGASPFSALPHWVDNQSLPYLVDLCFTPNWTVRLSIWSDGRFGNRDDVPHTHYGYIITTPITETGYAEVLYRIRNGFFCPDGSRHFLRGDVHLICPDTAHRVVPVPGKISCTLAVRGRPLREHTYHAVSSEVLTVIEQPLEALLARRTVSRIFQQLQDGIEKVLQ